MNQNSDTTDTGDDEQNLSSPGFLSIVKSTLAAAFGVQTSKNRERDFQKGNIWVFIAAGIIFTALFIFVVVTIVRVVLST